MAVVLQFHPWLLLHLLFLSSIPFSSCQPRNIETVYPFDITPPPPLAPPPSSPPPPTGPPPLQPQTPLPLPPVPAPESDSSSNKKTIVTAVAATAASTIVVAGVFFFAVQKHFIARRRRDKVVNSPQADDGFQGGPPGVPQNEFVRFDGNVRGVIVDENGLDVLYWRRLEEGKKEKNFQTEMFQSPRSEDKEGMSNGSEAIQEVPLLRGKSSSSHIENHEGTLASKRPPSSVAFKTIEEKERPIQPSSLPLPPARSSPIQNNKSASPPPPPPPPLQNNKSPSPPPPPPPPFQNNKSPAPPPPSPPTAKKNPAAPPPPPLKPGGLATSLKPPSGSKRASSEGKVEEPSDGAAGSGNGQVKMKPLHWDKVNKNGDHSMVWDKIDNGSFR